MYPVYGELTLFIVLPVLEVPFSVLYTGKLTNLIESLIFFEWIRKVEFVYGHAQHMYSTKYMYMPLYVITLVRGILRRRITKEGNKNIRDAEMQKDCKNMTILIDTLIDDRTLLCVNNSVYKCKCSAFECMY